MGVGDNALVLCCGTGVTSVLDQVMWCVLICAAKGLDYQQAWHRTPTMVVAIKISWVASQVAPLVYVVTNFI
ncbi:hypothetical protein BVRB_6g144710 [Beta vulgaris subsp. vulgaris]|nr:hypothetical protein BVRB_6g144710 [Beta vulgaris subsp. vulgaris]